MVDKELLREAFTECLSEFPEFDKCVHCDVSTSPLGSECITITLVYNMRKSLPCNYDKLNKSVYESFFRYSLHALGRLVRNMMFKSYKLVGKYTFELLPNHFYDGREYTPSVDMYVDYHLTGDVVIISPRMASFMRVSECCPDTRYIITKAKESD